MKWEGRRQSDNLEDRRGMGNTGKVIAGGGALGLIFLLNNHLQNPSLCYHPPWQIPFRVFRRDHTLCI